MGAAAKSPSNSIGKLVDNDHDHNLSHLVRILYIRCTFSLILLFAPEIPLARQRDAGCLQRSSWWLLMVEPAHGGVDVFCKSTSYTLALAVGTLL